MLRQGVRAHERCRRARYQKSTQNLWPNEVLKGISLEAHKGDVISIIGSSGSGKSTFLRCINLLETPTAGEIWVNGELIQMKQNRSGESQPVNEKQVQRIRSRLAMVFQSFNLWSHMTVLENVIEAPVHVLGVPKAQAIENAELLLKKSGSLGAQRLLPRTPLWWSTAACSYRTSTRR